MDDSKTLEEWRNIKGYDVRYRVSSMGRVFSVVRNRMRSLNPDRKGYIAIDLWKGGEKSWRRVHHLVLLAFVGARPPRHECAHLNGCPSDNRSINLEWVTSKENARHREEHGRTARGSRNGNVSLTERKVLKIRKQIGEGCTMSSMSKAYRVNESTINRINNGESWRHILPAVVAKMED